jgi:hypothetical protein
MNVQNATAAWFICLIIYIIENSGLRDRKFLCYEPHMHLIPMCTKLENLSSEHDAFFLTISMSMSPADKLLPLTPSSTYVAEISPSMYCHQVTAPEALFRHASAPKRIPHTKDQKCPYFPQQRQSYAKSCSNPRHCQTGLCRL